jgi:ribonucleoside-diphosphate reductase subunit M1
LIPIGHRSEANFAEAKDNASAAKVPAPKAAESLVAPMRQVQISTTTAQVTVPPAVAAASTARAERTESSPGPSEEEEISYEEAKKRAEERAEAALQCSIENKDACLMCSG